MAVTTSVQITTIHFNQINTNANLTTLKLLVKHVHLITQYQKPKIVKIIMILTVLIVFLTSFLTQNDYQRQIKLLKLNSAI